MKLSELRNLIENGRVAKLRFKPQNSIHYIHEVRVKKFEEWYIYQLKIFLLLDKEGEKTRQFSEHTDLLEWSDVLKQLGRASSSSDWAITDEEIDDPFPPERRTAP
jgi:hypothetical protein